MTDSELIAAINDYMANHKGITRRELRVKLNTSLQRLEKLEAGGVVKLPPKLSRKQAATLTRKKRGIGYGWFISKPANWKGKGAAK